MEPAATQPPSPEILPILGPLAGSTALQIIILLLAALFVFWRLVRGMQLGGPRQFVSLMALIMGIATGWSVAPSLVPVFRGFLGVPDFAVQAFASASACLLVIVVVEVLGAFFCGKTAEQENPKTRRLYAVTGLALGMVNGLVTLVIMAVGINLLGTVANTQLYSEINRLNQSVTAPNPNTGLETDKLPGGPVVSTVGNPYVVFLARLKNSAELGPGKEVLNKLDPIPPEIYRILQKSVKVLSDPACTERLLQHPDISRLTQHELLAKLAQDPEIRKLAQDRQLMGLMRNPKMVAAANDPAIQKDFGSVKFEEALDFALAAHKDTLSGAIESGEVTLGTTR